MSSKMSGEQSKVTAGDQNTALPASTVNSVGFVGAGQLGRMMGLASAPLGLTSCFLGSAEAGQPAEVIGPVLDQGNTSNLKLFTENVDVLTYESENVDADWLEQIAGSKPVHPNFRALRCSQHRWREKDLFKSLGIETAPYAKVTSEQELQHAVDTIGLPLVVKTATEGYDGKGQARLYDVEQVSEVWHSLTASSDASPELIAEGFVTFERELSVIAVRSASGEMRIYPITVNEHKDGILRVSTLVPGQIDEKTTQQAEAFVTTLMEHLDYVGVIALELFDTQQGLIANEMAPRVHNTGHWTQLGAVTSQFENHVRAISGLPLGATDALKPCSAMINLIGSVPDISELLAIPNAQLHLYGKAPREGRKLGHVNLVADSEGELGDAIAQVSTLISS